VSKQLLNKEHMLCHTVKVLITDMVNRVVQSVTSVPFLLSQTS